MLKLFAGLALACLCSPAVAQDADCQPVTTLIADAPAQGYSIADDIKVKGTIFDRETVIVLNGSIFIWFSMDGCIVAKPLYMGDVPAAPAPAPADPAPAKLQGGGAEINS